MGQAADGVDMMDFLDVGGKSFPFSLGSLLGSPVGSCNC